MSALLLVANYFGIVSFLKQPFFSILYAFHGFFFILSVIIHFILQKAEKGRPQQFIINFMGMLTTKMLLSMFLLLGYLYFNRDHKVIIALNFFIIYIAHTIFETIFLLKKSTPAKSE